MKFANDLMTTATTLIMACYFIHAWRIILLTMVLLACNCPATLAGEVTGPLSLSNDRIGDGFRGNYPLLYEIPNTGFECVGRIPGYYADDHPISLCQVFHYCHHDGRIFDFLCPNTTIFNQKVFACDHFYNFECGTAKEFYYLNDVFLNGSAMDNQ